MKALKILVFAVLAWFIALGLDALLPTDPQREMDFVLSLWNLILF